MYVGSFRAIGPAVHDRGQKQSGFACALGGFAGALNQRTEINVECLGDTKECVDRWQAVTLFDTHDHRVAEAGASCDFVQRQLLPAAFRLKRGDEAVDRGLALAVGGF